MYFLLSPAGCEGRADDVADALDLREAAVHAVLDHFLAGLERDLAKRRPAQYSFIYLDVCISDVYVYLVIQCNSGIIWMRSIKKRISKLCESR